jgi:hypothetical protein
MGRLAHSRDRSQKFGASMYCKVSVRAVRSKRNETSSPKGYESNVMLGLVPNPNLETRRALLFLRKQL